MLVSRFHTYLIGSSTSVAVGIRGKNPSKHSDDSGADFPRKSRPTLVELLDYRVELVSGAHGGPKSASSLFPSRAGFVRPRSARHICKWRRERGLFPAGAGAFRLRSARIPVGSRITTARDASGYCVGFYSGGGGGNRTPVHPRPATHKANTPHNSDRPDTEDQTRTRPKLREHPSDSARAAACRRRRAS